MNNDMLSQSGPISPENNEVSARFSDLEMIYRGSFNIIARAKRYGRWWALKALRGDVRGDAGYRLLLRKEFDILISMQHPNIVSAVSFEEVEGLGSCIVMEWIDGRTLKDWLGEKHSRRERLRVLWQIFSAVEYVHAKQVVVRDLKPSNLMLTRNGENVKLIDFGLSDTDNYTIFKQPAGSQGYVAPEQKESRETDIRNDIYSLGCIIEDMRLGRMFPGVVRKCKLSVRKRFCHVEDLRRALIRVQRVKRVAWAVLFLLVFGGMLAFTFTRNFKDAEIYAVADSLRQKALQDEKLTDSLRLVVAEVRESADSLQKELKERVGREENIRNIIADGKEQMNKIVAVNMKQLNSIEVCESVYYARAEALRIFWKEYPLRFPDLSETEVAGVRSVLGEYYTICIQPLANKMQQLRAESECERKSQR